MKTLRHTHAGFTLIELLVALVILSVAGYGMMLMMRVGEEAGIAAALTERVNAIVAQRLGGALRMPMSEMRLKLYTSGATPPHTFNRADGGFPLLYTDDVYGATEIFLRPETRSNPLTETLTVSVPSGYGTGFDDATALDMVYECSWTSYPPRLSDGSTNTRTLSVRFRKVDDGK